MHDPTTASEMEYLNPDWQGILASMGIVSFDDWWNQADETVEPANTKPGNPAAWSKVSVMKTPCGRTIYLKRQENFYPNNLIQRWCKELTFEREYRNYLKIRKAGVPTYDLVCFHSRRQNGKRQAIYVCEGLDGFSALTQLMPVWEREGWPDTTARARLIDVLVETLLHMHRCGILHNALSPRHVFFNIPAGDPYAFPENIKMRLIDFERLKILKRGSDRAVQRDLFSLNRRCIGWPDRDRIRVLRKYLGIKKLDSSAKRAAREIAERTRKLNSK